MEQKRALMPKIIFWSLLALSPLEKTLAQIKSPPPKIQFQNNREEQLEKFIKAIQEYTDTKKDKITLADYQIAYTDSGVAIQYQLDKSGKIISSQPIPWVLSNHSYDKNNQIISAEITLEGEKNHISVYVRSENYGFSPDKINLLNKNLSDPEKSFELIYKANKDTTFTKHNIDIEENGDITRLPANPDFKKDKTLINQLIEIAKYILPKTK